jgi:hypothetical protein
MSEVRGDRSMGGNSVKITFIGALAIAVAIIAAVLLIRHFNRTSNEGSDQQSV